MFWSRREIGKGPAGEPETVIGRNASFNGHFRCEGNLRIEGHCEGSIEATGTVIISEMAHVEADIVATNVSISGAVRGKVVARDRLEILSTGRLWGSVDAASFLIDEGGYFRGESVMSGPPEAPAPGGEGGPGEESPAGGNLLASC